MVTRRDFTRYHDDTEFSNLFTDFNNYRVAEWVITNVGTNAESIASAANGILTILNAAADNDVTQLQWAGDAGAVIETFKFIVGKKFRFVAKVKVLEVIQSDFMIGLWITDTDPVGGVSDGIYFRSVDASAALTFVVEKNAAETVVAAGDLVADTYAVLEAYYDGTSDRIDVYVNRVRVGAAALTNAPDDEELALSLAIQNGQAVANGCSVDYIGIQQER